MLTKRKFIPVLIILLLAAVGIGVYSFSKDKATSDATVEQTTYSATDVLKNANFEVENPFIEVRTIQEGTEEITFTPIELSEEAQQELINIFENAQFEKDPLTVIDYDYWIKITLNTGYTMFVDSDKNFFHFDKEGAYYTMPNGEEFFNVIEKNREK